MRDMVLIADKNFHLSDLALALGEIVDLMVISQPDRIDFIRARDREFVQIERADDVAAYYEDEEADAFRDKIPEPTFYLLHFRDMAFLRIILS